MLQSLHIVNFAIIEDTIIELTDGATVFTGETGAGKSILIDALAILLGRRARTDLIRTGAEFFKVEGVFSADDEIVSILSSFGFDAADSQIIITRKLNRSGRGICTINGDFCTVKQLEFIGRKLVYMNKMMLLNFFLLNIAGGLLTGLRLKSQRSVMNMTIYIRNGKKLKKI